MKTLLLSLTILISFSALAQPPAYVPTNGLVAWYPFNGNANDESVNTNDGTVNGATLTTDRFGAADAAYYFDGVDDFIDINTLTQVAQNSDYTWSFWSNFPNNQFSGNSPFNATGAFLTCGSWWLTLGHSGTPGLFYKDEAGAQGNTWYVQLFFNQFPSINDWHHFVITKENTLITVFLDGQNVGSLTSYGFANFNSNVSVWLGRKDSGQGSSYYIGMQDDFGCWNRALTECEINDLYNASSISTVTQTGATLTADQTGATYQWLDCDNSYAVIAAETNQSYAPSNVTGNYAVEVTLNGCVDTSACYHVDYTGIEELNHQQIILTPNPTSDFITIEGIENVSAIKSMELVSSAGRVIAELKVGTVKIDVSMLSSGTYFLSITHAKGTERLRFVKE